jgi:hypothetical protein
VTREGLETRGPKTHLLLVEGPDDFHFVGHFHAYHGLEGQFRLKSVEGITNLLEVFLLELKSGGPTRLGIIIDVDVNVKSSWDAVSDRLKRSGFETVPKKPDAAGTIVQKANLSKVGIWLMPNNRIPGSLEDFARLLIPTEDKLWDRAVQCVQSIPEEDRLFPAQDLKKAHIHTWLAWQRQPGIPMGQALQMRALLPDAASALPFVAWLNRLFVE